MLYHGTSARHLESILKYGLLPRSELGIESTSPDRPGMPDRVYLTEQYAPYFASCVSAPNEEWLIVGALVNELSLVPDEYALAVHVNRLGVSEYTRDKVDNYTHMTRTVLINSGLVAHVGRIPSEFIHYIVLYDPASNPIITDRVKRIQPFASHPRIKPLADLLMWWFALNTVTGQDIFLAGITEDITHRELEHALSNRSGFNIIKMYL